MAQQVVSLSEVRRQRTVVPRPAPAASATDRDERVRTHPCYDREAHHYFARLHVAVAPACNIQCHYCNRKYDCANESRPGVVSRRQTPEDAVALVAAAARRMPALSVVGIAGPGDALCDHRRSFDTFRRIAQAFPDLTLCLSTNGLDLPDHVDSITALGIDHVTITINTVDPDIGAGIIAWVAHGRRRWTGRDAARILLDRQLDGLDRLAAAGVLVKVNSVLIPGLNDTHMAEVNRVVRAKGAVLHNIMPLISDPAHGTHFGLTGQRGPTATELAAVQQDLGIDAKLMRHCRQCRADAIGLLGQDQAVPEATPAADGPDDRSAEARAAYRAHVATERADRETARHTADAVIRRTLGDRPVRVAVCTKGGGRVNRHFGKAAEFHVYLADAGGLSFEGIRRADNYCRDRQGNDDRLAEIVAILAGVDAVLCERIGERPRRGLAAAGIEVWEDPDRRYLETAIGAHLAAQSTRHGQRTA